MARAFEGVRVVEFAQVISGPMAASLLGFLGADVIKVETPGEGDQGRRMMDGGALAGKNMSTMFQGLNTGKRSLGLNLKHPGAREVVRRLVAQSDVVIENLRPGVMTGLGYDYAAVREMREDIIFCSISGFGQTGPMKGAAAYDGAVQAASGMMLVNGAPGQGPLRVGFPVVDAAAGMTAAFAVASALYRRAQTGEGQYLDVGMLDAALSLMSPVVNSYLIAGAAPAQMGNMSVTGQPTANVFPVADGFLQITALTAAQLRALWAAAGRPEMADDPRMATVEAQAANAADIRDVLIECLRELGVAEWVERLGAAGVPCSPVLSLPQALAQEQLAYRDALTPVENPLGVEGMAPAVVNAAFMATPDGPRGSTAAPLVGQDTDHVLAELGYSDTEIEALRQAGVV
ncbi:MAG: CaiB/BaiF CoA transferase family protein [Dehalococcoidia bacterium]